MEQRTCEVCGNAFSKSAGRRGPWPKTCSRECRREKERRRKREAYAKRHGTRTPEERRAHAKVAAARRWAGHAAKPRLIVRADDGSTASRITCEHCGRRLTGKQQRYCSRRCNDIARGVCRRPTKRTCPVDGVEFMAANNKRFCSKRCGKRFENSKRNGADPTAPLPGPFNCAQCGKRCVPGENVPPHASRFCSNGPGECKAQWHKTQEWYAGWLDPSPLDDARYRQTMRLDPCSYCGRPSQPGQALDHIVPRSYGGPDDSSNRTSACRSCNSSKQQSPLLIYLGWNQSRAAFEPWSRIVTAIHTR